MIVGEKIIGIGIDEAKVAYIKLSSGQVLYLDECENDNLEEELNE